MRTHVFNAALPLHKVSQHMQNTIAQHHQKILGRFHAKAITPETVEHASRLFSAAEAPVARKIQCFVQILTFKSHPWFVKTKLLCEASFKFQELKIWTSVFNAAVPIKTVSQDMQNTLEQGLRSGLCSLRHMPTGHNDLCTVLVAGANWTQWSLGYVHLLVMWQSVTRSFSTKLPLTRSLHKIPEPKYKHTLKA